MGKCASKSQKKLPKPIGTNESKVESDIKPATSLNVKESKIGDVKSVEQNQVEENGDHLQQLLEKVNNAVTSENQSSGSLGCNLMTFHDLVDLKVKEVDSKVHKAFNYLFNHIIGPRYEYMITINRNDAICNICQISLRPRKIYDHFQSSMHVHKQKEVKELLEILSGQSEISIVNVLRPLSFCTICDVHATIFSMLSHLNGKKHVDNYRKLQ